MLLYELEKAHLIDFSDLVEVSYTIHILIYSLTLYKLFGVTETCICM